MNTGDAMQYIKGLRAIGRRSERWQSGDKRTMRDTTGLTKPSRSKRRFLLGGLAAGGVLLVGWGIAPPRQRLRTGSPLAVEADAVALNGWVAIARDGTVSVVV